MLRILERTYGWLRADVGYRQRSANTFHHDLQLLGASVSASGATLVGVEATVGELLASSSESATIVVKVEALVRHLSANTDGLASRVDALVDSMAEGRPPALVADINRRNAQIINFANAHDGYASQCGYG